MYMTFQRIKLNKFKKGHIFIWCDDYEKILETLSGLKEYDILFKDKIKINQIGFFKYLLKILHILYR